MFTLHEVSKSFQGKTVIPPLTLELAAGQTTALIGPSGCGKSTLLRLLVGLIEPDAGTVSFNGQRLEPSNLIAMRRQMGFVLQDGGLFPHLTIRQNVALMARQLGWEAARIDHRITELTELTRLDPGLLDRRPTQVSGGQRQRVAMMRALMLDPPAILLDEPMGALDPLVRYELQEDLRTIFRSLGKTVVLVTHDLTEAAYFGHDLLLLKLGHVVQRGSVEDFRDRPVDPFVTQFLQAQRSLW
ncbi:MAG: ATP-binding cassette domain-containing protein [Planctomycetaceae bacterium]|nr:ATP-binding cassette domain-containing protein [Planctomycetaceae bacterium]